MILATNELRLKDVASFMGGGTPNRSNKAYFGGSISWVKTTDLNNGLLHSTEETITELGLRKSSCKIIPKGSVLIAMYGGFNQIGRTGLLTFDSAINQAITAIVPNKEKINPYFLLEWLNYRVDYWKRFACSSRKDPNITKGDVEVFPIPRLQIHEQHFAANVLTCWSEAIEIIERLIAAKEEVKKGLMQRLLTGKCRLNGFNKPWKEFQMGDLFKERSQRGNVHLPLLSITREEGVIHRDDVGRKDTSNADKSKYLRICPGDIGYNTMRMWQGVSALSALEGIVSPAYTIVTPRNGVDGEFMAYLFKLPKTIHLFYRYSQGLTSDTWNLKFRHFREIKVNIPEINEQKAIAQVFKACDAELSLYRKKLAALHKQKRGLMQKLLSGHWRLNVIEEAKK